MASQRKRHSGSATCVEALDPRLVPKFVNQLFVPPVYEPAVVTDPETGEVMAHEYTVEMSEFIQQVLPPPFPGTRVWGYGGIVRDAATGARTFFRHAPGPTFEATRGVAVNVRWINNITQPHLFAVDPTLRCAQLGRRTIRSPASWPPVPPLPSPPPPVPPLPSPPRFLHAHAPVPAVPHLHGGEVPSDSDGHPDAWFTYDGVTGPAFVSSRSHYPNRQPPATLWYHDNTLGITRLNVGAGLAGFYLLRDPADPVAPLLPSGKYEIPLLIQDRSFRRDGSFFFPSEGINPAVHPHWVPGFFGDAIMVNGRVWPNLNVEPRQYRFRILNGSNARFFNLSLSNHQSFTQIGADGGYLPAPVELTELLIAPGERADVLIDFSTLAPGTTVVLRNNANAPFPDGAPPDVRTVGQVMQFTVVPAPRVTPPSLPPRLNEVPELTPNAPGRIVTLGEVTFPGGLVSALLDGQEWAAPLTELPVVGSTEDWEIVNLTPHTHPIHLHLVQFQLVSRQRFDVEAYRRAWARVNGTPPITRPPVRLAVVPYLVGDPVLPAPHELGWKDTIRVNPGEVTRIRVRFAPADADAATAVPGVNLYPFDPGVGPGYVWCSHILEQRDNEMMRPYRVVSLPYRPPHVVAYVLENIDCVNICTGCPGGEPGIRVCTVEQRQG